MSTRIGNIIRREGKAPLCICGFTEDGKYLAYQVLRSVAERDLLGHFSNDKLAIGIILKFSNGRQIELIGRRESKFWDIRHPGEVIQITKEEIEELEAADNAREAYSEVATKLETGTSRNIHFLPRRTE